MSTGTMTLRLFNGEDMSHGNRAVSASLRPTIQTAVGKAPDLELNYQTTNAAANYGIQTMNLLQFADCVTEFVFEGNLCRNEQTCPGFSKLDRDEEGIEEALIVCGHSFFYRDRGTPCSVRGAALVGAMKLFGPGGPFVQFIVCDGETIQFNPKYTKGEVDQVVRHILTFPPPGWRGERDHATRPASNISGLR